MLTKPIKDFTIIGIKSNWRCYMMFEKIREIICEQLELEEDQVTMDSILLEDLGADSIDLADLVMTFEDEFNMEISDEALENIKTVSDIVKYVEEN